MCSSHTIENSKYRFIYDYEFYRGISAAAETVRRINNIYGAGVAKKDGTFGSNIFVLEISL